MRDSTIRLALAERDVAYGTWIQMNSPEGAEVAAASGMDFVIVDTEHGSFGIEAAVNIMRGIEAHGASAMLRVPDDSRSGILKALDAGARAVLVPNVNDAATARAVAAAASYAPDGIRGACACVRVSGHGATSWPDYLAWSRANVMVGVLIETAEGIKNVAEIVAVPGIHIIGLGPFDLSQALGHDGDWKHPEVIQLQERIVRLARKHGLEVMASITDSEPSVIREQVDGWRSLGVRMFALSGDRFMLSFGYRAIMASLK